MATRKTTAAKKASSAPRQRSSSSRARPARAASDVALAEAVRSAVAAAERAEKAAVYANQVAGSAPSYSLGVPISSTGSVGRVQVVDSHSGLEPGEDGAPRELKHQESIGAALDRHGNTLVDLDMVVDRLWSRLEPVALSGPDSNNLSAMLADRPPRSNVYETIETQTDLLKRQIDRLCTLVDMLDI